MSLNVLVIGGVACGPKTVARLKRLCPESNVTLIEKERLVSYGACGLPYYVEGLFNDAEQLMKTAVGVTRTPEFFAAVKGCQVMTLREALSIDRAKKSVTVRNLEAGTEEDMHYDKLVLATGGYPARPPISGLNLKNTWFISGLDAVVELKREIAAQGFKKAVLIGSGFIGVEMAEALAQLGLEVTIVEMFDQILPGAFDEDIALFCAKYLRQKGVKLVLGEKVIGIEGNGKVESVRTERQSLAADVVIVATGIRPNDKLAREAGLLCADPGGILVNEYCQTSDRDIYAGGDCVVNAYCGGIAGSSIYAPMGSTANKHGRVIANHIAGHPTPFGGITCTAIVRAFDFTIGRTGMLERQARELHMDVETFTWGGSDLPHFMPERKPFLIKMVASRRSRKLLGVQVAGMGNGSKRLDVAAGMIFMGATLDQVADIDFGYAPPYSQALDPLATCAHMLSNKLDGLASSISSVVARNRLEKGEALLLDVRTPREVKSMQMPFEFIHIPLGELRNRAAELPRDRDILIACLAGLRAYEAQRILNAAGFDRVQFFEGGLSGWPFEVIRMTRG